jgi:hypothetical protein
MTKVCFLEQPGKRSPDSVMPLTVERLRELGCSVEVLVPEWEPSIIRCLTLDADLYVWKSHERLCDSLAAEIHARRLPLINDYCGTLQVRDKIVTSMRLMEAGLPTPEAYYASSVEQLRAIVKDYPIVVKPNSGRRGQQISVVRSPEDLDTLELTYSDIFAQQLVRGGGLDRAAAGRGRFCMSSPRCLVIGAGRVAGGFVAPLLRDAGWEVTFVSRNRAIVDSVNEGGGLWVRTTEDSAIDRWIGGVSAVSLHDHELPRLATRADLLATSVGPSALPAVGKVLAPLLCARVASSDSPINIVTFENYRRAPEILATSLMREDSSLAGKICRRVGIGGAVVWRAISRRTITDGGLRFEADVTSECYADALPLVPGAAPLDGSIPGISLVRAFDDRMVEKL